MYGHTGLGRLNDGKAGLNGLGAFGSGHFYGSVLQDVLGKHFKLALCIVVVDVNRQTIGLAENGVFAAAEAEHFNFGGGVVTNDGTLGAVQAGTHRVVAFAAGRYEHLGKRSTQEPKPKKI